MKNTPEAGVPRFVKNETLKEGPSSLNFSNEELMCKCGCGKNDVNLEALQKLQELREKIGKPLTLTSAYRCSQHPVERIKVTPGRHHEGVAFDIKVKGGIERREIVQVAMEMGWNGIGVHDEFVHIDDRPTTEVIWVY